MASWLLTIRKASGNIVSMVTNGSTLLARHFQNQEDVAAQLNISPSMLSLIVNGKRRPGRSLAVRIQQRFGIPVEAWERTAKNGAK